MQIPIRRSEPFLGNPPDYSKALYSGVPSHDFCVWLIMAEMMRHHHDASPPLKVRFLFQEGLLGKYDYGSFGLLARKAHKGISDLNYSNVMVTHVLRPAIGMIGGINESDLHAPIQLGEVERYCEYDHHIGHLVDAARQGFKVPQWRVPAWAFREVDDFLKGDIPVVITLRECMDRQPARNSNLDEWLRFVEHIQGRFSVLIIRDNAAINMPFCQFRTWHRATADIHIRAALYQRAFCNLSVQNGTNVWFTFSGAPYLIFKQLIPALPDWDHGNEKGWREQDHMEIGDQLPWAGLHQRMTWKDDTFENIRDEFDAFLSLQAKAA